MKFALTLLIIFTVPCYQADAQKSLETLNIYDHETIYIDYSFWGNGFVKDGQFMSLGAFGSNLAKEVSGSRYALEEMRKARRYGIISSITSLVGTTLGVIGIVNQFRDNDDHRRSNTDIALIITGGILGTITKGFNQASMAAMNRAVWLYNRDVVSGGKD